MTDQAFMAGHKRRILIFSQRNIFGKALSRCPLFEFEDIICQIDSTEILAPAVDPLNARHSVARRLAFHAPIALNPGIPKISLQTHYDLFVAICAAPGDLLMVNALRNWRDFCKTSVCLLDEVWLTQMRDYRHFLRILKNFDLVIHPYSQGVKKLSEQIGRKCVYFPPGVDAILFCPYPERPKRVVDVYSIGRRSKTTHQKLLRMVTEKGLFYLHDSLAGDQCLDSKEHRALFANVVKRSRYFIVNPALIDRPETRGNQIEIGNRYFEGAAGGSILVGECPYNGEFERLFPWPDAVIHLPYDSSNIDTIINDLDSDPERQDRIRRTNVVQALTRYDWVYRWETILETVGLEPLPGMSKRKERLRALAATVLAPGDAPLAAVQAL
jgi:hypothetical protein